MQGIAEFHKVSLSQFIRDSKTYKLVPDDISEEMMKAVWSRIKCPKRATGGSAGYDFCTPFPFCLQTGRSIVVPTGIRVDMQPGWFLMLLPRSGLSFKFGTRLGNTAGIVDADYYYAENEGHILVKMSCASNMSLQEGDRFVQGIFVPHGITRSDATNGIRTGGFGSTGVE